ncbi:polysaccharide biosynthesis protein [Microbaculum marinisediminis]|uniref:UDP-glucose 4-epimerase n=1 Tax=Microbaculum marinisediminis TaxID=2931392 RepID=A0AAW5R3C0_9HYPH|nr:polysaccharide biosynthesis protein [Microbaculum sp. A6E488]MCT8974745.1 polysaccharide biosynthesis protein [Microbaculum sp. A6E488]
MQGKTILITGGTGSFGGVMVRHALAQGAGEIRILSRDEEKQDAMRNRLREPRLSFYIGDVRDPGSVDMAMAGADMVFHAAALKQVPSCEFFPMEAVRTNVVGSSNVIDAAIKHDVDRVVCLSTDKAVLPINAMGMSKAMMEKLVQAASRRRNGEGTVVACVRYGNVMYSRGSVIPLFLKQLRDGGPITVTNPQMTRFLLPLIDSVALVEHALTHAEPGDVFIKKAPACTIGTLAEAMKALFEADVDIRTIGVRHGEKLFETLATADELAGAEDQGDYWRIRMDGRDLDYASYFSEGNPDVAEIEDYTSHNTEQLDLEGVVDLLLTLPEIRAELGTA